MKLKTIVTTTVGATCLGVGIALATATPALADEGTTEVFWLTSNTTEPTASTVIWPQTLADPNNLACGAWYQADTYPSDAVDGLTADGVLTQGEDYAVVVSWRFVYGGDCVPVQPADVVTGASSTALDCVARISRVTVTETRTTHALIDNVWVLQEPVTVQISDTNTDATAAECPLPVTPAPLPTIEKTATVTATPNTTAPTLAETGPITGALAPIGAALLTLGGLLKFTRRGTK